MRLRDRVSSLEERLQATKDYVSQEDIDRVCRLWVRYVEERGAGHATAPIPGEDRPLNEQEYAWMVETIGKLERQPRRHRL